MRIPLTASAWCVALLFTSTVGALETDQFTVPPKPLKDIGDEVADLVANIIRQCVAEANIEIEDIAQRVNIAMTSHDQAAWSEQIHELRSGDYLAKLLYERIGKGLPAARIEFLVQRLAEEHEEQPAIYKTRFSESILRGTWPVRPLNAFGMVPTIHLNGVYMGRDKLGHFFQQGYEYYRLYRSAEREGKNTYEAQQVAVQLGARQENGVYGQFHSGLYSNADMAANYAGLKFYLNLTRSITIAGRNFLPVLVLEEGRWQANSAADHVWGQLLQPFISEHLNEAMNPPRHDPRMGAAIRQEVRKRGKEWFAFYRTNREREIDRLATMATWFGEEYGQSGSQGIITIVNAYFEETPATQTRAEVPDVVWKSK